MDIRKLQRAIVDGLEDVKAHDIVVFDTEHMTPLFERVIVASGTSNRQTKALASSVRDAVKARGFDVLRTEGEVNGEWIIVDCGAAVAHIMQPEIRRYYHLEEIWGDKPVALKKAAARGLVKAESAAPAPVRRTAAKAPAGKAAAPAKAKPRKPAAQPLAAKPAPAKPSVAKPGVAKRPAAKKSVAPAPARRAATSAGAAVKKAAPRAAGASAKPPARRPAGTVAKKAPRRA